MVRGNHCQTKRPIVIYVAIAIAVPYQNVAPTVSDVLQTEGVDDCVAHLINAVLSRLRRKGVIGQSQQKRPVTVHLPPDGVGYTTRCFLLLG